MYTVNGGDFKGRLRFIALLSTYGFTPASSFEDHENDIDIETKFSHLDSEINDVFPYAESYSTEQSFFLNGKLSCFQCGAYQNVDDVDFESTLHDCMHRAAETAEAVECPNHVVNKTVTPFCYSNKMMAAGRISSYTRGCMIYYRCDDIDDCETHVNKTGSCQTCCREDFCNRAAGECLRRVHGVKLLLLALATFLVFLR